MRSHSQADWVVKVDRQEFYLLEKEYQTLKSAAMSGKTMVWFEDFVISIPHISYMDRIKRPVYKKPAQLPETSVTNMHEKIQKAKKKIFKRP